MPLMICLRMRMAYLSGILVLDLISCWSSPPLQNSMTMNLRYLF